MNQKIAALLLLIAGFGLASCEKDKVEDKTLVEIRLTDDPCDCQQVNLDLKEIQVKTSGDTSQWLTLTTNTGIYDLLLLQGVNIIIATGSLPLDTLKEVRFVLGPDCTVMVDSIMYDLETPSAEHSGLKVKIDKQLGLTLNSFVLDFDAGESVKVQGNGKYKLDPVIRLQ